MKESPIFIKSYETLLWILNHTKNFPRHQRFVMAKRIEEASLDLYDNLVLAIKKGNTIDALKKADYHLERLKIYNRFSKDMKLLSFRQYEYLSKNLDEIGRLLGGWIKSLK